MEFWRWVGKHFIPGHGNDHRPHLLRRPWLLFFLAFTLATEGFLVADLIARQTSENFLAAVVPGEIIALTNDERAQNGAGALTENTQLDAAALAKAKDMALNGYFAHVGPDGKTPWEWITGAGYQYSYAGENLAVRFVDSQDVVNAWMASPTHRENIVKPVYTQIGVGVAEGLYDGQPATYVVQYFGTPLGAAAAAAPAPAVAALPAPAPVAAASPAPQVEGASVSASAPAVPVAPAPAQGSSFVQSLGRALMRGLSEPASTSNWILGGSAALLLLALVLTFFIHVQIQHPRMLATGATVAGIALFLLVLNVRLTGAGGFWNSGASQAASPIEAAARGGVVIDSQAAATGFALFPR